MSVHLIAGLGNPGRKYEGNRHNIGFMVVDELARRWDLSSPREKFDAFYGKVTVGEHDVVLLKPQTYMNLSGTSVQPAMHFFKVPVERLVCVHDELDLSFGTVKLKAGGGLAGHNGLRSVVERCGSEDFNRCRVGIGRPSRGAVEGYVLSNFSDLERADLQGVIDAAADAVESVVRDGIRAAMNRHHGAG